MLFMNQSLGVERDFLPGRENRVADAISNLEKDKLTHLNSLSQACLFMSSYRCYDLLLKLKVWILKLLAAASEDLLEPLRLLRYFSPAKKM